MDNPSPLRPFVPSSLHRPIPTHQLCNRPRSHARDRTALHSLQKLRSSSSCSLPVSTPPTHPPTIHPASPAQPNRPRQTKEPLTSRRRDNQFLFFGDQSPGPRSEQRGSWLGRIRCVAWCWMLARGKMLSRLCRRWWRRRMAGWRGGWARGCLSHGYLPLSPDRQPCRSSCRGMVFPTMDGSICSVVSVSGGSACNASGDGG